MISTIRRWKQIDLKFRVILGYIMSLRPYFKKYSKKSGMGNLFLPMHECVLEGRGKGRGI